MIFRNREITVEEAIEIMKQTRVKIAQGNIRDYETAKAVLIKATGYRVARRPVDKDEQSTSKSGTCPTCNRTVAEVDDINFCHNCGQRLIWD